MRRRKNEKATGFLFWGRRRLLFWYENGFDAMRDEKDDTVSVLHSGHDRCVTLSPGVSEPLFLATAVCFQ